MAAEIVERREDFESPGFGSQPDVLIEKYARHIITWLGLLDTALEGGASEEAGREGTLGQERLPVFWAGGHSFNGRRMDHMWLELEVAAILTIALEWMPGVRLCRIRMPLARYDSARLSGGAWRALEQICE